MRCGQVESKIAISESNLQEKAHTEFITPLKAFLEVDIKNVLVSIIPLYLITLSLQIKRERRLLNAKRLDLDAWKTNVKKAQNEDKLQQVHNVSAFSIFCFLINFSSCCRLSLSCE